MNTPVQIDINMDIIAALAPPPPEEEPEPEVLTKKQKKALAKAAAKERNRLAKLEETKMIMRDEFRRELELSKRQVEKVHDAWKEVVHATKIEELKQELTVWFEKMDKNLQTKDEMIESILEDIDQVHIMHKRAFFSHIKTIDYLNDSFQVLADVEQELYETQATEMVVQFMEEMKELEKKEQDMLHHIADIEANRCLYSEMELETDFHIYVQRMDERILQEIFRRFDYRDLTLERMRSKYDDLVKFIDDLKNSSYDKDQFTKLQYAFERHKYYSNNFEKLKEYEARISKVYSDLQKEYIQEEVSSQKELHNLDLENKYFTRAYNRLKRDREKVNNLTTDRMKVLTLQGRKVLKFYKEMMKKGELLLALVAECRKFQTQNEKIVREDYHQLSPEELNNIFEFSINSLSVEETLDFSEESLRDQFKKMRNFWKRFSDVSYQNYLLECEKEELEAENESLQELFKQIHNKEPTPEQLQSLLGVKTVQYTKETCPNPDTQYKK